MRFLNQKRVLSNMWAASYYLTGTECSMADLKESFISSMNREQKSTIKTDGSNIHIEFENPDLVNLLVEKDLFELKDVLGNKHLFTPQEQEEIRSKIRAALDLVKKLDGNLHFLIETLIGSIACYRIADRDGGSISCCTGLIFLSPQSNWPVDYYAEMLVHEFIHNSLFLEDMIRGIFPRPDQLDSDDALVTSVIRKTRRGYDKSYHSACVAAALMYFHHLRGDEVAAETHAPHIKITLTEMEERDHELSNQGKVILTDNGREIISELRQFMESRNYELMSIALEGVRVVA